MAGAAHGAGVIAAHAAGVIATHAAGVIHAASHYNPPQSIAVLRIAPHRAKPDPGSQPVNPP
jgi:hypothetical protein